MVLGDLLLHAIGKAQWVHSVAAREHRVGVHVLAQVDVALHERVVFGLVDARLAMSRNDGWKSASGQRNRSLRMVISWQPSGSSKLFSSDDDDDAAVVTNE